MEGITCTSVILMFVVTPFVEMKWSMEDNRPVNVSVVEGDLAILPCPFRKLEPHQQIVWFSGDDYAITIDDRLVLSDRRFRIEQTGAKPSWDLLIQDVQGSDSDLYKCVLNVDPKLIQHVMLFVQVPEPIVQPSFETATPLELTVRLGEDVILPCAVSDLGKYNVRWIYKGDFTLVMNNKLIFDDPRYSTQSPFDLHVKDVNYFDDGPYTCEVDSTPPLVREVRLHIRGVDVGRRRGRTMATTTQTPDVATTRVPDTKHSATDDLLTSQLDYYKEQRKTSRLHRRVLQEQMTYYKHVNYVLKSCRDDVIQYLTNHGAPNS